MIMVSPVLMGVEPREEEFRASRNAHGLGRPSGRACRGPRRGAPPGCFRIALALLAVAMISTGFTVGFVRGRVESQGAAAVRAAGIVQQPQSHGFLPCAGGGKPEKAEVNGRGRSAMVRTVVQAGDTLWELAAAAYEAAGIPSESVDLRPVIYEIRKRNRMTSAQIVPGQVVLIPVRR